jgi:hypothetical protein
VGAACVIVVLGLVIVVARAGLGTQSNVEELLVAFGLPAVALAVLLVPTSVRELVASTPETPETLETTEPEVAERGTGTAAPDGTAAAVPSTGGLTVSAPATPAGGTPVEHTTPDAEPAPRNGAAPVAASMAEPRAAARPLDATQQMAPVRAAQAPDSTQVLPPVREAPAAQAPGWTVAQAMDPSTPLADLARISAEAPHLRSYVAANPSTYPALLDWLGALGDPAVDAALRSRR